MENIEVANPSLIYETDGKGEKMLVRSLTSTDRVYLRFTNKTSRPVDIWWRNFGGMREHYVRLKARTYFDVNSFMTHPWEFTDVTTKESYVIENRRIFRPPKHIAKKQFRTNWNITIGMRSLRKTTLLELARHIKDPSVVYHLELPRTLIEDLRATIVQYHRVIWVSPNIQNYRRIE